MEEQTRNADSRIKSYIDTIDALNKKESASRALSIRLKQELEGHYKELSMLRTQLNGRKLELEQEIAKTNRLERDLLEARTACQLLKGKYEALERRYKEEKSKWEEQIYSQETELRRSDSLSNEIENLRKKIEKSEAEMSKLRIENGRLREEEKQRSNFMADSNNGNSMGSNKRELLDEIEKKNSELQGALVELRNKQSRIEELLSTVEDLTIKIRQTEKDLILARSSIMTSVPAQVNEPFSNTSPVNLNSSRPSMLGNYSSQHASSSNILLVQQKDQEIADLKMSVADLKREVDEKTNKMQGLIRFLGDSESGYGEKEKRLEKKVEQKDVELSNLRREMIEREEESGRLRIELEENLKVAQFEKENAEEGLRRAERDLTEARVRCQELEATSQRLESQLAAREAELKKEQHHHQSAESELRSDVTRLRDEVAAKEHSLMSMRRDMDDCRRKEEVAQTKIGEVKALEEQLEFLNQQHLRASTSLKRYQEIANQIYCNSIKCDTVYKGGLTIFVKYARAVYIPLVFNYHPQAPSIGELGRDSSLEVLESYCQKIRKLQEQVCSVSFVLDMTSVSPKIKKLLEANSMVAVCRVEDVVQEKVDLKTNKELVSFVQAGCVFKVTVEEVVCLMSASFDNAIDLSEFRQMESGAQNKTFQY